MTRATTQQLEKDNRYSKRTQISLSPKLFNTISKKTALNKESMSAYIRKAIEIRIKNEQSTDEERMRAVKAFVGSGDTKSHPHWNTDKKVRDWQRVLRKDDRY